MPLPLFKWELNEFLDLILLPFAKHRRQPMFGITFFYLTCLYRERYLRCILFLSHLFLRLFELKQHHSIPFDNHVYLFFSRVLSTINYTYFFTPFISTFIPFFNLILVSLSCLHTFAYSALYRERDIINGVNLVVLSRKVLFPT